jgi:hypothetical protein
MDADPASANQFFQWHYDDDIGTGTYATVYAARLLGRDAARHENFMATPDLQATLAAAKGANWPTAQWPIALKISRSRLPEKTATNVEKEGEALDELKRLVPSMTSDGKWHPLLVEYYKSLVYENRPVLFKQDLAPPSPIPREISQKYRCTVYPFNASPKKVEFNNPFYLGIIGVP